MPNATGDDVSAVEHAIGALIHWGPFPALIALGGIIWRGSAKLSSIEHAHGEHAEKLKEHHTDIASLKVADAATRVAVASLPTRVDIDKLREEGRAQAAQLQAQMQAGFDNMIRVMARE